MSYVYSNKHKTGYLYGVPPKNKQDVEIEIVGLNRKDYNTSVRVLHMNIQEKNGLFMPRSYSTFI